MNMLTELELRADAEARHAHRELVEELEAKLSKSEALLAKAVEAALEQAANRIASMALEVVGTPYSVGCGKVAVRIRALASDPETVADIIEAAKGEPQ